MLDRTAGFVGGPSQRRPNIRGHAIAYRPGETNFCSGCGKSHWYIGRLMAECAYCGTALPLPGGDLALETPSS